MKLIRSRDLKSMPWRNGKGVTTEIAIDPPDAALADLNFNWRISRAELRGDGPFSTFPGYDRWLSVLGPDALVLNGVLREPWRPFRFAGEDVVEARLQGQAGFTSDLGIIFRRDLCFEMSLIVLSGDAPSRLFVTDHSTEICIYHCQGADVTVSDHRLTVGDALILSVGDVQSGNFEFVSFDQAIVAVFLGSPASVSNL